jgi:hypothetical protein
MSSEQQRKRKRRIYHYIPEAKKEMRIFEQERKIEQYTLINTLMYSIYIERDFLRNRL